MPVVKSNVAPGTPTWVDLGISDIERAKGFYRAVFGWEYTGTEEVHEGYLTATKNGHRVAGLLGVQEAPTAWWGVYFGTDDCGASVERATAAGATEVVEPMDVVGLGRLAVLHDPQGAQFAFWEGRGFVGCELVNETGGLAWAELVTTDADGAVSFYEQALVVGATRLSQPGLDYLTLDVDERPVAGVFGAEPADLTGRPPARWVVYFGVDDADEAARVAEANGGKVVRAAQDSPYGRFVVLADPFGAEFAAIKFAPSPQ